MMEAKLCNDARRDSLEDCSPNGRRAFQLLDNNAGQMVWYTDVEINRSRGWFAIQRPHTHQVAGQTGGGRHEHLDLLGFLVLGDLCVKNEEGGGTRLVHCGLPTLRGSRR